MIRNFKYRLFTNANQDRELAIMLESHRRLYNAALDGKMLCWDTAKANWSFYEQSRWFTIQRKTNAHWQRMNFSSAEYTLHKLDRAYTAFFAGVKKRCVLGRPRFKGRDRFNSFAFKVAGKGGGCKLIDRKIRLQFVGTIRVRWHRELPAGRVKQATFIREGTKWFVCLAVEIATPEPTSNSAGVGIDVGLKSFVTTSDGDSLGDSCTLETQLPELRRRQRALSRCKRGSNRRQLVKRRVTQLHTKVRNTRRDLHHKVARSLVDRYGVIAAESLNVVGMLRNRRLARRISDAAWGGFIEILKGKAESAGAQVILVDAKNTSQQCSNCGEIVRKSLAVRVHRCKCGCVLDRDTNAAINVLARAAPKSRNVGNSLHGSKSRGLIAAE